MASAMEKLLVLPGEGEMTSRARDVGRSHHRKGPETREKATHYLDPDVWREMELSRRDKARCAEARGELLLLSAILDDAMYMIFSPASSYDWHHARKDHGYTKRGEWEESRRLLEIDWVLKSHGLISARGICDTLSDFGWTRTTQGWPVGYDRLVSTVTRGLEMGLWLRTPLTDGAR
jgi:hypothetical protein